MLAIILCGTQDGDDNKYVTVGTKHVYTVFLFLLGDIKFYICEISKLRILF
jgi:hypothetical protein